MFTPSNSIQKTTLALDMISQRQKALSANLANIDTPGYKRRDIDFSQYISNSPLETTLSKKMGASALIEERDEGPIDSVRELTEMQKNGISYSLALKRMATTISHLKTVINVGN